MLSPITEIDTVAKAPPRPASKFSPPAPKPPVDEDGFPISYSDPEDEPELRELLLNRAAKAPTTPAAPKPQPKPIAAAPTPPAPAPVPTPVPQPAPKPEPVKETPAVAETTMSKVDAVRQALAADPSLSGEGGVKFVSEKFGVEINSSTFNNYKSTINKKNSETTTTSARPAPKPSSGNLIKPTPARSAAAATTGGTADLIREVRALLQRHDANEVIAVVEALSE